MQMAKKSDTLSLSNTAEAWQNGISVIMPTYKRPQGLKTALESLYRQEVDVDNYEIIISDNDPEGGARDYVEHMQKQDGTAEIIYLHATIPGVCNARNIAMDHVRGRFLVFVDDDMEVTNRWVQNMVDLLTKYAAGIAFSDVTARMPDDSDPYQAAMIPVFSRTLKEAEGYITDFLGMGGAALDTHKMTLPNPVFDPSLNDIGGEDDKLFAQLTDQGVKTAWSPNFSAYEDIPKSRATYEYIWKRNLAFGQGPTQNAADKGIKAIPQILFWMAVGIAQMVIYAPQYWFARLMNKPVAVQKYARLSQAIGKILWWDGFSPRLYGDNATTEVSS